MPIYNLTNELIFPNPEEALDDGLLAVGGDLSPERLVLAYQNGIFPWYGDKDPILWWSPDPRFVLFPDKLKVSRSMERVIRGNRFHVTFNMAFPIVISKCRKTPRKHEKGTWITMEMMEAYINLHKLGVAQSVEVWLDNNLVGGLYGLYIGSIFYGESMFSEVSNASKTGLILLVRKLIDMGCKLIDCQVHTNHLESLGAEFISRNDYIRLLKKHAVN